MPTVAEQIDIAAAPERVFALLAAPERTPEWTPGVLEVERAAADGQSEDQETRVLVEVAGRKTRGSARYLESEPPRLLVLQTSLDIGVTSTTRFELAARDSGTRLSARVEFSLPSGGLGLLGGLLGGRLARGQLRAALGNLKRLVEAAPPA